MKKLFLILIVAMLAGCQSGAEKKTPAELLLQQLGQIQGKGILFGHQDDLAYGKYWRYIDGKSDVKSVSGDYPAVFGWELGGLERGDSLNIDGVPFHYIIKEAIKGFQMGGVNTFSWHPYSLVTGGNAWDTDTTVVKNIIPGGRLHNQFKAQLDILAGFFLQLKTAEGKTIPFIFRPWHEMNGTWFWWGSKTTTPKELKSLFRFTIEYLKGKGLDNMVVCYSPNGGYQNAGEYLTWYPGDNVIDMTGLDQYQWPTSTNWIENTQNYLNIMIKVAKERNKLAAFTETGYENIPDSTWFTQKLGKVLEPDSIGKNLTYVLTWRNDSVKHQFFAYKGHPSEADARKFLARPNIWLLNDFKNNK